MLEKSMLKLMNTLGEKITNEEPESCGKIITHATCDNNLHVISFTYNKCVKSLVSLF